MSETGHKFRSIRVLENKRNGLGHVIRDDRGDPITIWVEAWVCDRCGCRTMEYEIAPIACAPR